MAKGTHRSDNLITAEELNARKTPEERRESARKAGKASGVARRERKTMQETLQMFLAMPIKDGSLDDLNKLKSIAGINDANISVQEGIIAVQLAKALKGDARAANIVMELMKLAQEKTEDGGVQIIDDY